MADSDISDLCPELQEIYKEWLTQCHAIPLAVKAIVTWRSGIDQDAAKANGLSNAGANQSPHNCCDDNGLPASRAFDFGVFEQDGTYVKDGTDNRYRQAGEIGVKLGLEYGGDWPHPDYDHLQIASWKTL